MKTIKRLAMLSLLAVTTGTTLEAVEAQLFENFGKLPRDVKVEILKSHLQNVKADQELEKAILDLKLVSKDVKNLVDNDPLLKSHIDQLRNQLKSDAIRDWLAKYQWKKGEADADLIAVSEKLKKYEDFIKSNPGFAGELLGSLKATPIRFLLFERDGMRFKDNKYNEASDYIKKLLNYSPDTK